MLNALSAKVERTLVLNNATSQAKEVHAFDIIARIIEDKAFISPPDPDVFKAIKVPKYSATTQINGRSIFEDQRMFVVKLRSCNG